MLARHTADVKQGGPFGAQGKRAGLTSCAPRRWDSVCCGLRWAVRKREHARLFDFVGRKGAESLPACGRRAGVFSTALAVCPLKQDVEQEITAKNAKRQEDRKRHRSLTWTSVNAWRGQGKNRSGNHKKC